jgi:integrase
LLQQKGIDLATVTGMLGHTTIKYVQQTYKRYLQDTAKEPIKKLPTYKPRSVGWNIGLQTKVWL